MKLYHVMVEQEDGWFVGRVLERPGVTTQGRTLDELVFMVRDATERMWDERQVGLELIVPGNAVMAGQGATQKTKANRKRTGERKKVA